MILGILKRQWLLLFLALSGPLVLNIVAIWEDVGTDVILKMWNGAYPHPLIGFLGGPYNPLPKIFGDLLLFAAAPGPLVWLMAFLSNKMFFQKQPFILKFCETLFITLLVAGIFKMNAGYLMPLAWLPKFHDSLGLPGSSFALQWSLWLIFPVTIIILLTIVLLSGHPKLSQRIES